MAQRVVFGASKKRERKQYRREHYLKNREAVLRQCKEYRCSDKAREAQNRRRKQRQKDDPVYREMRRKFNRRFREKNREKVLANHRRRRHEIRDYLRSLKTACAQCGESHPACIDYHHRDPKEKVASVARMIGKNANIDRIKEEIAKCDTLCANCHRKLHWKGE